jgi:DegV family protein with EDD domain
VEENKPIIHITLGSGISGTYMNATLALEEFKSDHPEAEIYVVDSTLASTSYGMLAIKAAEMRDEGASAEECVKVLEDLKPRINAYYTTDDLSYLYRGGRVSKTGKILAHALGICPILNLDDKGCLKAFEKCRGKKNTFNRIKEIIKELMINPEDQILYISHSDIEDFAENYGEEIRRELGFKGYKTFYIGTTIGAHTGPGLIALFFVGKERTPAK